MRNRDVWNGLKTPACAAMTAVLLAACGAPAGDDESGGGGGTPPPPAADATLSDVEGMALSVASARYQTAPSSSTSILTGQTVQLDAGALSGALNGQVQVAGETVTISNGSGTTMGGDNVVAIYEAGRSGDHAGALEVVVFDPFGALISENTFVFGIPTEDSVLGARTTGSLTYAGGFQANGILGSTNDIEYEGTMTLTANFASDQVSGSLDGTLNGSTNVDMNLGTGSFTTNSFSGSLSCSSGCSGSGAYDGAFYGPDVQEVGGVLTFDFTASGDAYIGAGTFILDNPS